MVFGDFSENNLEFPEHDFILVCLETNSKHLAGLDKGEIYESKTFEVSRFIISQVFHKNLENFFLIYEF